MGKTRNRVSVQEESEDGRLTRRMKRIKGGESVRKLHSLVSFLFVHFLLLNTFFPIFCRFTHISFQALDFLYFIPFLYGNIVTAVYLCIINAELIRPKIWWQLT